jgi:hypothetical protein
MQTLGDLVFAVAELFYAVIVRVIVMLHVTVIVVAAGVAVVGGVLIAEKVFRVIFRFL